MLNPITTMFFYLAFRLANFMAQAQIRDGGPVYKEFVKDGLLVEPWNAFSSFAIFLPAVFWFFRLYPRFRHYPFVSYSLPFIFLGGVGSTLFHAFRVSPVFLFLDFMPVLLFVISLTFYFWRDVLGRWYWAALMVLGLTALRGLPWFLPVGRAFSINFSYFISGAVVTVPALILLYRYKFRYAGYLLASAGLFMAALFFRLTDLWDPPLVPWEQGTHFLWHVFTGLGVMPLIHFLIKYKDMKTEANQTATG